MRFELAAATVLLVASAWLGDRVAIHANLRRLPSTGPERSLGSRVAEGLAIRKVAADKQWIEILQYCGDISFLLDRGEKLYAKADRATDMDPKFVHCYKFCGSMLMWQCDRPVEAAGVLKKGIAFNPEDDWLKLYLAAITYRRMSDLASEIAVLEQLAVLPNAPFMLRRILAHAYAKQGRIWHAAAICKLVLKTSAEPRERRWAAAKLALYSLKN